MEDVQPQKTIETQRLSPHRWEIPHVSFLLETIRQSRQKNKCEWSLLSKIWQTTLHKYLIWYLDNQILVGYFCNISENIYYYITREGGKVVFMCVATTLQ